MASHLIDQPESINLLRQLERRNVQLFIFVLAILLALAAGVAVVAWPNLVMASSITQADLPTIQILLGLVCLILLIGAYLFHTGREAGRSQRRLVDRIYEAANTQALLVDEESMVFDRRFLDYAVADEMSRISLEATPTTILQIRVFELVPRALNHAPASPKSALRHAADLLKRTFRGADTIVRDQQSGFLMLLPATSAEQARCALDRLIRNVDHWNVTNASDFELVLSWRMAECSAAADIWPAIQRLRREDYEQDRPTLLVGNGSRMQRDLSSGRQIGSQDRTTTLSLVPTEPSERRATQGA